jgi:hypothetical protein
MGGHAVTVENNRSSGPFMGFPQTVFPAVRVTVHKQGFGATDKACCSLLERESTNGYCQGLLRF